MAPVTGRLDVASALAICPELPSLQPDPWDLPGAAVVSVSFEIDEATGETGLPPAMHPSIPPYAMFSVLDAPESPVGPFTLGQVRIVGRAGIRPRGFLIGAVCTSAEAADALSSGWGYRVEVGEVSLATRHDRWAGVVQRDGAVVMEAVCRDPQVINGGDVDLIDSLHLVRHGGEGLIVQVDPEYTYHEAHRGHGELPVFDPQAWGAGPLQGVVRPTTPNVAVACRVDTDLPTPRFVIDPLKPAVEGTRRLETSASR
jgi:hypothetical protein